MATDSISTSTLLQRLFKNTDIASFIDHHSEYMNRVSFDVYINRLCKDRDTVPERIIKKSGIDRTYGHQIFNGSRKPSRDKVIQLALGFEMDFYEAQELLKIARKSTLYPKIGRDAVLIYALNKKKTVTEVQATLEELSMPLLGKEDRYE